MNPTLISPTSIVAYLALFAAIGFLFLFGALLLGRFLRSRVPTPEKMETYECGEPPVGPGHVQFNLRFYVIALVFLIFDVEVALFFPWATVFGKANQLRSPEPPKVVIKEEGGLDLSSGARETFVELGIPDPQLSSVAADSNPSEGTAAANEIARSMERDAGQLALASLVDIGVFFGVLLVGFAYVWKQGDLDWVRALRRGTEETTAGLVAGSATTADVAGP
jgi:NADH-quinone oxidoreductase subunit A